MTEYLPAKSTCFYRKYSIAYGMKSRSNVAGFLRLVSWTISQTDYRIALAENLSESHF